MWNLEIFKTLAPDVVNAMLHIIRSGNKLAHEIQSMMFMFSILQLSGQNDFLHISTGIKKIENIFRKI